MLGSFIAQGNKVKIVVMLRGREMQHSNLAFELANRFLADLENDPIQVEKKPQLEGRNVTLYLAPQASIINNYSVWKIKVLDFKLWAHIIKDVANMVTQNRILAAIAQLVEQGTENPCVLGSIPSCGTI